MRRVLLLGVSSAFPRAASDPTSFLVEIMEPCAGARAAPDQAPPDVPGAFILVDCGGIPLQRLLAMGRDPARMIALAITHTHPDHLGGLPLLIHGLRMLGRTAPLPVIGHDLSLAASRRLLEAVGLTEEKGFPITWIEMPRERRGTITVPPFEITTFAVRHSRATLGLRIETGGRALVYSSDTGPGSDVAREARGAAILLHEMGAEDDAGHPFHSSPADLAAVARDAEPGRLVIVHAPPLDWTAKSSVLAQVHREFAGPVEFGEPGSSYLF